MSAEFPESDLSPENPNRPNEQEREDTAQEASASNPGSGASADSFFASSDEEVDQLRQKLADAEKRVLIAHADLENFRKRMRREREDELKYANAPLLSDLLPVIDNLQRAIESAEKSDEASSILEGVKLVEKQMLETMKRRGCEPIAAQGEPFDPNLHEAIMQQPSGDVPPGTVVHVTQVGYRLFERVLRPSQVIVSKAADEA